MLLLAHFFKLRHMNADPRCAALGALGVRVSVLTPLFTRDLAGLTNIGLHHSKTTPINNGGSLLLRLRALLSFVSYFSDVLFCFFPPGYSLGLFCVAF